MTATIAIQLFLFLTCILLYILQQNALGRDCNDKYIELIEGHYLEFVVL